MSDSDAVQSNVGRFRQYGMQFAGVAVVFAALILVSEFLMSLFPCLTLGVVNPFTCLLLVGLYQDQVGFFHEFRHYPILLMVAVGIAIWWSRRERRKRPNVR
jgi:hypothetical protein